MIIIVYIYGEAIACCLSRSINANAIENIDRAVCTSVDGESLNIVL